MSLDKFKMRVPKLLVLVGLSASGKSTFANKYISEHDMAVIVERDRIRKHYFENYEYSKANERTVKAFRDKLIRLNLRNGYDVVCSDTNLHRTVREELKKIAEQEKAEFEINDSFLKVSIEECIRRDARREKPVGEAVIRRQASEYEVNRFTPNPYNPTQNCFLPRCIIVDIDGTVALKGNRNAYDESRVLDDTPNLPVIEIVNRLQGTGLQLIFVSGRKESSRGDTFLWLMRYFKDFKLFMRPVGDNRKDVLIKKEIYENFIKDNYYVQMVFDDRFSVCRDVWYKMGLPLCRVGDPEAVF